MPAPSGRHSRANAYRIAFLVVAAIGACLSADLVRLHVRVYTDPDFSSFCAMSKEVNCETVALSDYSVFLGLPLAVWGLLCYFAIGGLAIWGLRNRRTETWPYGALFWITSLTSVVGIVLFFISHYEIHSICVVCTATYFVSFALLALSFAVLRRAGSGPLTALSADLRSVRRAPGDAIWYAAGLIAIVIGLQVTVPRYWQPDAVEVAAPGMLTGHTKDGHPWIGAKDPIVEIVEYSDYQCPHCRRAHFALRKLIQESHAKIRLVHRYYPLDKACNRLLQDPFHPRACEYAVLAYCADEQGKFWPANDYLFANGGRHSPIQTKELARALGLNEESLQECATGQAALAAVRADIEAGIAHRFNGTPAFVVDGHAYLGHVPAEILRRAIETEPSTTAE